MVDILLLFVAIVGGGGLIGILKNRELIKNTLADWTHHWRKVIYFLVSPDQQGDVTLHLYFCGEETSWLFPSTYENHESYILAMKQIHYDTSYPSNSDRYHAEWKAMFIHLLDKDEYPCLLQLIGECGFRFRLPNGNGERITHFDSFKFKTELKECLKKCEIEYDRKASTPQDKWKARDK